MTEEKMTILMIDDDVMLLKLYEMAVMAHKDKMILIKAENTGDGLRLAETQQPDVILLDLILGKEKGAPIGALDKVNGFNYLLAVKGQEETKRIPVVIFSNLDTRSDLERANALGAADYIVKAKTSPEEVLKRLEEVVQLERAAWTVKDLASKTGA